MSGINLAYDSENNYDLNKYRNLSNNQEDAEIKNQEQIIIQQKKLERRNTAKIIVMAFAALVLLFCVVYGKVQVSDIYSRINSQKNELTVAESENARLKAELESYTSLRNIEEYAKDIGLKKLDKAQIWYVDIQQEDVVKIPEKDENFFVKIKRSVKKFFYKFE
jgi:cell division protein FtsL